MNKESGATLRCIMGVSMLALAVIIFYGCGDDGTGPEVNRISCTAGCSSMSWSIDGESGGTYTDETCNLNWVGNNYIATCSGSITYTQSGNTYNFSVVYDWIDCDISVTVTGEGTCTDS